MHKGAVLIVSVCIILGLIYINYQKFSKHIVYVLEKTNDVAFSRENSKYGEDKAQREVLGFLRYNSHLKTRLQKLVKRKAPALDPDLIEFVKVVIDHPAPRNQIKMSRVLMLTPQAEEIDKMLKKKVNGFFVEAGGLDGERSSNTIWLEQKRGWTGLLVEPDPFFYTQLVGKNRNAWSINGCVSPYDYISEIPFKQSLGGQGKIDLKADTVTFKVPCYPLLTLLAAINISHVDFFSLDVEGAEGEILESLPLDKMDISTFAVEYLHGNKKRYVGIMQKKGYKLVKDIHMHKPEVVLFVDDYIFAKNDLDIKVPN